MHREREGSRCLDGRFHRDAPAEDARVAADFGARLTEPPMSVSSPPTEAATTTEPPMAEKSPATGAVARTVAPRP